MAIHQGADQHVTASRHTNPHKVGKKKKKSFLNFREALWSCSARVLFGLGSRFRISGGETNFPRAGGKPQPHDFDDCSKGVSVTPRPASIDGFLASDSQTQMIPAFGYDR